MLLHDELQRRRAQDPALVEGILGLLLAELAKSSAIANEGADPWGAHNPGLEAARMVGYEDALYFSRLFEKRYGKSPRFYREDMKDSARPTRQQW
jgi:AraC-like DNA-binding protein